MTESSFQLTITKSIVIATNTVLLYLYSINLPINDDHYEKDNHVYASDQSSHDYVIPLQSDRFGIKYPNIKNDSEDPIYS